MRAPPLPGATRASGRRRVHDGVSRRAGGLRVAAGARSATPSTRRKQCATWFHSMSHCPGRPLRQRSSATRQRGPAKAPKRSRAAGAAAMRQRVAAALVPAAMGVRRRTSGVACAAAARFSRRLVVRSRLPRDRAGDHGRPGLGPQRVLERPERILVGARFDDEEPADVEAELGEAVAIGLAEVRQSPPRGDEHGRTRARMQRCRRQGEQETERRRPVAVAPRGHLMEDAAGQAGTRQKGLQLRYAEREVPGLGSRRRGLELCQGLAQGGDANRTGTPSPLVREDGGGGFPQA